MKKVMILTVILLFAIALTACGGNGDAGTTDDTTTTTDDSAAAVADNDATEDTEEPVVERDTIFEPQTWRFWQGMSMADAVVQWHDTEVGRIIQEITGITIETEFIVGDVEERAALVVAAGDFPDFSLSWHAFDIFRDAGAILPLNDLYEEYMPTVQAIWGPHVNRLKEPDTGVLWGLAALGFGTPPLDYPTSAFFMRVSAVEHHGWQMFTNPDDYFQAIREYIEANPYNADGQRNIGFSGPSESWRFVFSLHGGNKLHGFHNTGDYWYDPDNNWEAMLLCTSQVRYDYLLRLWELNQEGLLDPEFLSQDHDGYVAKVASGRVVGFYDEFWQVGTAFNLLRQEGRREDMFIPMNVTYDHVVDDAFIGIAAMAVRPDLVIFNNAANPELILQYLDFLASEEMIDLRTWGIEGQHYQRNADGRRYLTPEQYVERSQPGWADVTGVGHIVQGAFPRFIRGNEERGDGSGVWYPQADPARAQFIYSDEEQYNLSRMGWTTFMDPFSPMWESPYGFAWDIALPSEDDFLLDLQHEWETDVPTHQFYQRMIMADSRDEFDSIWNEMIAIADSMDLQPLLDFRTEEVRRRVRDWSN